MADLFGCLMSTSACPAGALEAIARACTPRVERHAKDVVLFDASGLTRVIGPPADVLRALVRLSTERGMDVRVALAGTRTTARLLAQARPDPTLAPPGGDADALSSLPVTLLASLPGEADVALELLPILHGWGVQTMGALAALPRADVRTRLGAAGVRWHQAACGEDTRPLVPSPDAVRFVERVELEWPIDALEPLSFVLARLCDAHEAALVCADRGAVAIETRLTLVTRRPHMRTLRLPEPMRDARLLRTLILLDLESHPPDAAIDVVEVTLEVAPGRIAQGGLFGCTLPTPEALATLVARLHALIGESRIGAPIDLDTHDDRLIAQQPFALRPFSVRPFSVRPFSVRPFSVRPFSSFSPFVPSLCPLPSALCPSLGPLFRRFPAPIAARVAVSGGRPVSVDPAVRRLAGGAIVQSAGPWRSSGQWWTFDGRAWDRDDWEVELAGGTAYRLSRDRATSHWNLEGVLD